MASMLVQFEVKDYIIWKKVFDTNSSARRNATIGGLPPKVFQDASNPNQITVMSEWNSLENAKSFANSIELDASMSESGVIGVPTFTFLNDAIA